MHLGCLECDRGALPVDLIFYLLAAMANGIHLATATNLLIRRHAYSKACFNEFAGQSDSESAREADTDESTDDGIM